MRNKILMQLLRATGTVELEVKTDFGQVSLTAKRAPNETKTFLVVMGNRVNKTVYSQHEDLTYEQAQENSLLRQLTPSIDTGYQMSRSCTENCLYDFTKSRPPRSTFLKNCLI